MPINIKKIDGRLEPFNADRINQAIAFACQGLPDAESMTIQIASETELTLYDGITTKELDEAAINACVQNIKDDPSFDRAATRLLLKTIYKTVLGDYINQTELHNKHIQGFSNYIQTNVANHILDSRLLERFDLNRLGQAFDLQRDELFTYTGLSTLARRYITKSPDQSLLETPQYFFMRVAMGLALNEQDPNAIALQFYEKMSKLEYIPGGSTNINAGTVQPRLSNCYLMEMEDSIDHIGKTVSDVMKLSKATGGIGLAVTKLRANGSPINTNNTNSSGPIPFLHIIDSTIRAISRAGKKMGALCFYMENWHYDFDEFLDLKQNAGDDYRRSRTANTAVYMSDEFMRRAANDDWWYLFDPKETPDLVDLYGQAFSRRYAEYVAMAENNHLNRYKRVKALDQFRKIIVSLQTTSHPWLTWKDAINVRNLNKAAGTIYCSNLCTEITLPQNVNNVSVCNLLSINLARHLTMEKKIDWDKLASSTKLAIRQLDNLVDINEPPIPEARNFDQNNRAVGLGIMGFNDLLEKLGYAYDGPEAPQLIDEIMEFISYQAIDQSAELARLKGSYPNFSKSEWAQGLLPVDTIKQLEESRGQTLEIDHSSKLNWESLRAKTRAGMRNATLMAIAPTANIGLVAGTSPGLDPRFAQMFSRTTLGGKYMEVNHNLVNDLKQLGLWEKVREDLLTNYGSLENIDEVPETLKRIYKDSFSVDPFAFINVAARAQKWIDQAISRNMYLSTRDTEEIIAIYTNAWKQGLKTTYYLHMRPRHKAEQSTTKVNKGQALGKRGFGAAVAQEEISTLQTPEHSIAKGFGQITHTEPLIQSMPASISTPIEPIENRACPIDPQERLQCDSCQ